MHGDTSKQDRWHERPPSHAFFFWGPTRLPHSSRIVPLRATQPLRGLAIAFESSQILEVCRLRVCRCWEIPHSESLHLPGGEAKFVSSATSQNLQNLQSLRVCKVSACANSHNLQSPRACKLREHRSSENLQTSNLPTLKICKLSEPANLQSLRTDRICDWQNLRTLRACEPSESAIFQNLRTARTWKLPESANSENLQTARIWKRSESANFENLLHQKFVQVGLRFPRLPPSFERDCLTKSDFQKGRRHGRDRHFPKEQNFSLLHSPVLLLR